MSNITREIATEYLQLPTHKQIGLWRKLGYLDLYDMHADAVTNSKPFFRWVAENNKQADLANELGIQVAVAPPVQPVCNCGPLGDGGYANCPVHDDAYEPDQQPSPGKQEGEVKESQKGAWINFNPLFDYLIKQQQFEYAEQLRSFLRNIAKEQQPPSPTEIAEGKDEKIYWAVSVKDDIAKILQENIYLAPQVNGYVVHGAIEKIIEYFKPLPAQQIAADAWKEMFIEVLKERLKEFSNPFHKHPYNALSDAITAVNELVPPSSFASLPSTTEGYSRYVKDLIVQIQHHIDTWPDEPKRAVRLIQKCINKF